MRGRLAARAGGPYHTDPKRRPERSPREPEAKAPNPDGHPSPQPTRDIRGGPPAVNAAPGGRTAAHPTISPRIPMPRTTALAALLASAALTLPAAPPALAQDADDPAQAEAPAQEAPAEEAQADDAQAGQAPDEETPAEDAQTEVQPEGTQPEGTQAGEADAPAQAQAPAPDPTPAPVEAELDRVLATVDGTDITLGHVVLARRSLPQQFQGMPDEALLPGLVDQLVQQTLLADAAGDVPPSVTLQLENEERNLRAAAALRERLGGAVTEQDVRAAYEERVGGQEPTTEYRASHILVETEEEAREIVAELEGGADFADLARARSTGPSGPRGGDLGFFGEGMMVEPFQEAVEALSPGEVSEPVQTQFGWHVIRLEETRQASAPPFEALAPEIAQELQREAVQGYLAELTAGADITREPLEGIDPSVLSRATVE